MTWVAGADGCRGGWLAVFLDIHERTIIKWDWKLCLHFQDVLASSEHLEVLTVDMPIGLLSKREAGERLCDREARRLLGRKSSSIFTPPIRAWLRARDYDEVRCHGVSRQAFAIFRKIEEVDQLMSPSLQRRVVEAHPELAFGSLDGQVPRYKKKSPEGFNERVCCLSRCEPEAFSRIRSKADSIRKSLARMLISSDDILDAVVLAWTAFRIHGRQARRLPDEPPLDLKGLRMEIWY